MRIEFKVECAICGKTFIADVSLRHGRLEVFSLCPSCKDDYEKMGGLLAEQEDQIYKLEKALKEALK